MGYDKDMEKLKSAKQMERHLKANEKTIGEHTRRLQIAGLINKKYNGKFVEHELSPYGKSFVQFLQSFQRIK